MHPSEAKTSEVAVNFSNGGNECVLNPVGLVKGLWESTELGVGETPGVGMASITITLLVQVLLPWRIFTPLCSRLSPSVISGKVERGGEHLTRTWLKPDLVRWNILLKKQQTEGRTGPRCFLLFSFSFSNLQVHTLGRKPDSA